MIDRCHENYKWSTTKSLNVPPLPNHHRRLIVEHQCQSQLTPADCNLYVSQLRNKHARSCQLSAQFCNVYVSIKVPCNPAIRRPAAPAICTSKCH